MEKLRRVTRSFTSATSSTVADYSVRSPRAKKQRTAYESKSPEPYKGKNDPTDISINETLLVPSVNKQNRKAPSDMSHDVSRIDSPWKIGAHVSSAGGVENAVYNASAIGANAFALFLKSQRKWTSPPLTEHSISEFKARMKEHGYDARHVIPHGSYLINLANPDDNKREKSYECFLDDLRRCEALGLEMYNFHPGSTVGATTLEHSISLIADCINRAHAETKRVVIVLENMAGAGNIIGGNFAHLAKIIKQVNDKARIGVCFDTCHAYAAGYDFRTKEGWEHSHPRLAYHTSALSTLTTLYVDYPRGKIVTRLWDWANLGSEHSCTSFAMYLPMVLETPSFESPREVWGAEIGVLGRLSLGPDAEAESWQPDDLEELTNELRMAVNAAGLKSAKIKGKKVSNAKVNGSKKRKRASKQYPEESLADGHGPTLCEHD